MVCVFVHQLAQPLLLFRKGFPCFFCPFPEACGKLRQRKPSAAVLQKLFDVLTGIDFRVIARVQLQRLCKVSPSAALLVQIVPGVSHAEVPGIGLTQLLFVGLHQFYGPAQELLSLRV